MEEKMNPFTFGNPISDPMRFMNRKNEADLIFTRLHNSEFESSSIVGERRIGKTSLLNYLAHASIQSAHGLDPDKYLFVYMNLQMVDENTTPTRLWQRLLQEIDQASRDMHIKQMIQKIYETEPIAHEILKEIV
jgi:hypothetical protein